MVGIDRFVDIGLKLHIREWPGEQWPFVLVHGLASNCLTWEAVARRLAEAGHSVVTVDQRGHGLSEKPDNGYNFATVTADLAKLVEVLKLNRPIMVGQSWGGNVMLEFGARYPGVARGFGFVDGGYIKLRNRPDATWEQVSTELKPPHLTGTPREELKRRLTEMHPDWSDEGIASTLANFEHLPDGSIRPWLTLPRHMEILRAMWDQDPATLYPLVKEPALICVAADPKMPEWTKSKAKQVNAAQRQLLNAEVRWFEETDHDIHVQKPDALADLFLSSLADGIWSGSY